MGHWTSWDDDTLILDRATNRFGDPAKVHRLDHVEKHFKSRGPFTAPLAARPPDRHRGRAIQPRSKFSGRWAEVIFAYPNTMPQAHRM